MGKAERKIFIGFLMVSVIIMIFGITSSMSTITDKIKCTETVKAIIIDEDTIENRMRPQYPIFSYTYNNEEYRVNGEPTKLNYKVGDEINIYIEPSNPTHIYYDQLAFKRKVTTGLIFYALGFIQVVSCIVYCCREIKRSNKRKVQTVNVQ